MSRKVLATADPDLTQAPNLDCPPRRLLSLARQRVQGHCAGSQEIGTDRVNLASAPTTAISIANALPRVLMCFFVRNNLRPGGHCVQLKQVETSGRHFALVRFAGYV